MGADEGPGRWTERCEGRGRHDRRARQIGRSRWHFGDGRDGDDADADTLWRGEERIRRAEQIIMRRKLLGFWLLALANKLTNPTCFFFSAVSVILSMGVKGLWTLLGPVGRPVLYV